MFTLVLAKAGNANPTGVGAPPARPFPGLLQRGPPPPGPLQVHPGPGLCRPAKGHPKGLPAAHYRLREDRVSKAGKVSLRYGSRQRHIGVGRAYAGARMRLLIAERDLRVVDEQGELI